MGGSLGKFGQNKGCCLVSNLGSQCSFEGDSLAWSGTCGSNQDDASHPTRILLLRRESGLKLVILGRLALSPPPTNPSVARIPPSIPATIPISTLWFLPHRFRLT